jgi:hypothetical protein
MDKVIKVVSYIVPNKTHMEDVMDEMEIAAESVGAKCKTFIDGDPRYSSWQDIDKVFKKELLGKEECDNFFNQLERNDVNEL